MIQNTGPITIDGEPRWTGCRPRVSKPGEGRFRVFGDAASRTPPVLSDEELRNFATNTQQPYHWHTIDQSRQNSCCPCAGLGALKLARKQAGLDEIILSQASLYAFDGVDQRGNPIPRRADNGMSIDACLDLLTDVGACPTSVIDQYDWKGFYGGRWPEDWREQARPYRVLEAWDCVTVPQVLSAVAYGFPVVYGCKGHAVVRIDPDNDLNSWGTGWGRNGVGQWATPAQMAVGIRQYGAWALRAMADPVGDGDIRQAT